NESN
ncbi:Fe-S cluster assembly protein DRE2, putative, partial [Plasmodium reichenowi]